MALTYAEAAIQQALVELSRGRTTLVIAHRLATIKNADRIVVVTEDGIAEQGQHNELIAAGGIYSGLHSAQFGFYENGHSLRPQAEDAALESRLALNINSESDDDLCKAPLN